MEQYESWQKMSFRNRCMIAGANGVISLSIPVVGGRNVKEVVKDIRIDNMKNWQSVHWRSVFSAYKRSPWFEFYRDELEFFYNKKFEFLWDWNLELLNWILKKLEIDIPIRFSEDYKKEISGAEIKDIRNKILPRNLEAYQAECPPYNQVFMSRHGFIPNLSIIDLLFCEGKNALNILKATPLDNTIIGSERWGTNPGI